MPIITPEPIIHVVVTSTRYAGHSAPDRGVEKWRNGHDRKVFAKLGRDERNGATVPEVGAVLSALISNPDTVGERETARRPHGSPGGFAFRTGHAFGGLCRTRKRPRSRHPKPNPARTRPGGAGTAPVGFGTMRIWS